MFDHIGVVVSDFAKSKAFYAQALAPIGHSRVVDSSVPTFSSESPVS